MTKTIYEEFIGSYVRVFFTGGQTVGKLIEADFDRVVLSPYLYLNETAIESRAGISEARSVAPYSEVKGMQRLNESEAEGFMTIFVEDVKLANQIKARQALRSLENDDHSGERVKNRLEKIIKD